MKAIRIILIVFGVIVALLFAAYAYYGGFKSIEFHKSEQGGETIVYQEVIGDYSQTPDVQNKIYEVLKSENIETSKGIGVYYDNPDKTEKSKMRSDVGCILEQKDIEKASTNEAFAKAGYQIKVLPKGNYIVTEFPFKGQLSVLIGLMKVYPAFKEYINNNKINEAGAISEIYDIPNGKIIYRKEIF